MIPQVCFIIPYRDRACHRTFFLTYMAHVLSQVDYTYEIYFAHQMDTRPFNRGAMKNMGFLAIKAKYPSDYQNMTLVFHDIDTVPYTSNLLDYRTWHGWVKHFYGFEYALGGIVSMTGGDFEAVNGFPCYWGWGQEDTLLQQRVLKIGLHIDRTTFFAIGSPQILQLFDGVTRFLHPRESLQHNVDHGTNGLRTMRKTEWTLEPYPTCPTSTSSNVTITTTITDHTMLVGWMVQVHQFESMTHAPSTLTSYDLRDPISVPKTPSFHPTPLTRPWSHSSSHPPLTKKVGGSMMLSSTKKR